jgi:hypothetical protein
VLVTPVPARTEAAAADPKLTTGAPYKVGDVPTTTPTSGVTVTPSKPFRRGSSDESTSATTPLTIGKVVTTRPKRPSTSACALPGLSAVIITRTVFEGPRSPADATWAVGTEAAPRQTTATATAPSRRALTKT